MKVLLMTSHLYKYANKMETSGKGKRKIDDGISLLDYM